MQSEHDESEDEYEGTHANLKEDSEQEDELVIEVSGFNLTVLVSPY